MTCLPHKKDGVPPFFLIISLVISVFAFSGYTGPVPTGQTRSVQTELLVRSKPKDGKAISFQMALAGRSAERNVGNDYGFCALALLHGRLSAVKFGEAKKQRIAFQRPAGLRPLKMIPRSEDGDFVHAA